MPGLGLTKGLSFVNDWEKDIDRVYQQEEYAAKIKAQREQNAAFDANLMKQGHGSTPYVEGRLNEFYKKKTKEMADFAISHPGFRQDVTLMQKYLAMGDEFINNPILQQDLQVKQNFERLQEAYANNKLTKAHFEREMAKYKAYAYADPTTEATPYVFENPREVDLTKVIDEAQKIVPKISFIKQKGNTYETYEGNDPIALRNAANVLLSDEDNKLALEQAYKDAVTKDPAIANTYKSLDEYTASLLEAGNKIKLAGISWNEEYLRNISKGGKSGVAGMYFFKDEYLRVSKLKDGETTPGSMHSIALTLFHDNKTSTIIGPQDSIKVYSTKDGSYKDLDVSLNAEVQNFKNYKMIGNQLYGEVTLNVSPAILDQKGNKVSQATNPADPKAQYKSKSDEVLANYGFTAPEGMATGPMALLGGSTPGKSYSGTAWVPIELNASNYAAFDKSWGGITEVDPAFNTYSSPEFKKSMEPKKYTPEEIIQAKQGFMKELNDNKYPRYKFWKDITDPDIRQKYGSEYIQITVDGKDKDEDGNPYLANIFTGQTFVYQR